MIQFVCLLIAILLLAVQGTSPNLEGQLLEQVNRLRSRPQEFVRPLEEWKRSFEGKTLRLSGRLPLRTQEGVKAVDEAIRFLRRAKPLPALELSPGLSRAARDHVADSGPRGIIGHQGSDGSNPPQRISRYGRWSGKAAENVAYGPDTALEILLVWIVDDGVPDRGHRKNLFQPEFQRAGTACGPHSQYGSMCVLTLAAEYEEGGRKP